MKKRSGETVPDYVMPTAAQLAEMLEPNLWPDQRFCSTILGLVIAPSYVRNFLQHDVRPHYGGNGGWLDVLAHIPNSLDSLTAVSVVMGLMNCAEARYVIEPRKALAMGAVALAVGCGLNAAVETPMYAHTAVVQRYFPNTVTDVKDEVYGDVASAFGAAGLGFLMVRRRPEDTIVVQGAPEALVTSAQLQ